MASSQKNTANAPENVSGIGHSDTTTQGGGGIPASSAELAKALELIQKQNEALRAELAAKTVSQSAAIDVDTLAAAFAKAMPKTAAIPDTQPVNTENLNRSFDYNTKTTVDGRSMFEAQQTLQMFKDEPKFPLMIPSAFRDSVGSSMAVAVNGVRISVPCDGRVYQINESHYIHFLEKMQKIGILKAKTQPQITVINND